MKKYLIIACAALLFAACSKEEEEGPYVPWFPPEIEGNLGLENSTKALILTEQKNTNIMIFDQPTGQLVWQWQVEKSSLPPMHKAWFELPDEAKPVFNRTCMLITGTRGGVALVRTKDKKVLFYANPEGMPHSAEVLPDCNIVVASSQGNYLTIYKMDTINIPATTYQFRMPIKSGHNVVWDQKRNCLWSAAGMELLQMDYNGDRNQPKLTQTKAYQIPNTDNDSGAHECTPIWEEDAFYISTNKHVWKFDLAEKKWTKAPSFQQASVKSISMGPKGYEPILTHPNGTSYYTNEVSDFIKGDRVFFKYGYQIYKARWYVENEFSYPKVHELKYAK